MAKRVFFNWLLHRMEVVGIRSQADLSAVSGISQRTVSRIFKDESLESTERSTQLWLARTLKVSVRDLQNLEDGTVDEISDTRIVEWEHCGAGRQDRRASTEFIPSAALAGGVPVLGKVMAGGLVESFEDWNDETGLRLPVSLPVEGAFALEIAGDSMLPAYQPGEYVILRNIAPTDLRDGEDVMIQLDGDSDGKAAFKRVYILGSGRLKLVSLNQKYEPVDVNSFSVIRVGRLLGKFTPPRLIEPS